MKKPINPEGILEEYISGLRDSKKDIFRNDLLFEKAKSCFERKLKETEDA